MPQNNILIDLDAAKKLFDDIPPFIGMTGKCVQEMLDKAPAVDAVEVVHGHWVYSGEPDDDRNIQANCSVCGAGDKHATSMIGHVPYCWKCGAKMDGGADNGGSNDG